MTRQLLVSDHGHRAHLRGKGYGSTATPAGMIAKTLCGIKARAVRYPASNCSFQTCDRCRYSAQISTPAYE